MACCSVAAKPTSASISAPKKYASVASLPHSDFGDGESYGSSKSADAGSMFRAQSRTTAVRSWNYPDLGPPATYALNEIPVNCVAGTFGQFVRHRWIGQQVGKCRQQMRHRL